MNLKFEERENMQPVHQKIVLSAILMTCALLGFTGTSLARSGQFYFGITATGEWLETSYDKTVDNTDPSNDLPRKGEIYRGKDSIDGTAYGAGILAGYRVLIGEGNFFISSEIDAALHGDKVEGTFSGAGTSEGRNQLGENWPERWSFEKKRSYGLTLRLGGSPELLQTYKTNLYAAAGVRLVQTKFNADYTGCPVPTPCTSPDDFESGTLSRDPNLTAWTGGMGLEKMIGEKLAVRSEIRYTIYEKENWVSFANERKIRVPAEIDTNETSLSISLIWYP